jgi:hypothetical protein
MVWSGYDNYEETHPHSGEYVEGFVQPMWDDKLDIYEYGDTAGAWE